MIVALLVVGILVLLIVAHEFGHFVVAKLSGVKVEEFGIGYPPRAFSFGKWGGTEYTLNWVPFGGFVRLFGDEGEQQRGSGSLVDSPRWKQALILVAGVAANALLGWFLFAAALHAGIPRVVADIETGQIATLIVADVVSGSPADAAGIKAGDHIIGVSDEKGAFVAKLTPSTISDFVSERGGKPISITYLHAGATTTTEIIPAHAVIPDAAARPALGVALALVTSEPLPWGSAMVGAIKATRSAFVSILSGLGTILGNIARGSPNLSDVIGPIGLVGAVGDAAQNGFGNVLALAAFISINLAVINLIPVPALDGGRLVLLGLESAFRRSAPRLVVQILNALGVALNAALMIAVTYHDIARIIF